MDLSAARRRGLRASTGGGDASRGAAMAGGKKARAKLKSGRLENRMRAGNGSDPTSQGGVGSSRPPRSQSPDSFEGVISMSREAREEVALVQSAFETALSNENSYIQGRLKEEFPLMVYPIMEATPTPGDLRDKNDIKSILDIVKDCPFSLQHRTLFSALKVETQGMLLAMGSHIAWLHGGAFQKLPADLLGCLWNESPDVSVSLFAFLETHETFLRGPADADKKQKYKAELLATFGSEAKPETLQALERRLDAWYPGHSPSTPTPPSRAAAADDVGRASSDASGPPSLAPSEGDDDDETRDSRLPPSDAPFRNGETVTNDDDDDDDDCVSLPSGTESYSARVYRWFERSASIVLVQENVS